jgi:hypothetical protein
MGVFTMLHILRNLRVRSNKLDFFGNITLDMLVKDKHSSLLNSFISYKEIEVLQTGMSDPNDWYFRW